MGSVESKRDQNSATWGACTLSLCALPHPCGPVWHLAAEILEPQAQVGARILTVRRPPPSVQAQLAGEVASAD